MTAALAALAARLHAAEATVTRLRAERDQMRHDLLVAIAHDGRRDGRVGVPVLTRIACGLPIPWQHVGADVAASRGRGRS